MGIGYLTISTHTGEDALPVARANITIKKDGKVLYNIYSDQSGNTDKYALETEDIEYTLDQEYDKPPYRTYDVDVQKQGYTTEHIYGVEIFDTETTVLPVMLVAATEGFYEHDIIIPENGLLNEDGYRQTGVNASANREVFIPEYITVHLGTPTNSAARNVRVKFADYIKNVASSEIYPTWPYNALVANIHCIVTFALNRIYTEWYRSRGFNFDITNSTAYDQYFVDGRSIYENISTIVDNIFNIYARRFGFRNPFFTQYCNGTTSVCQGLSQWGTVTLANQGYSPLEILRYYFTDDIELTETNNISTVVTSYPGYSLSMGMSGAHIQRMQNFLNRIRINYPLIPQIANPNGQFGADTQAAVRAFQRAFNMTVDGVIGKATWNKINFIHVGVIKLAELNSEGERLSIGQTPPNTVLKQGSTGNDVLELQFIINALAPFYNELPYVVKDGKFGSTTKNAVIEFQRLFNLTADGIVGRNTWNKLYEVYRSVQQNVPMPSEPEPPSQTTPAYPGTPLRVGSSGPYVRLIQNYLNTISIVYNDIPRVVADGEFGSQTQAAVTAFQRQFLLTPDGIVGANTWNKIMQQFLLVTGNASVSTTFPGTPLKIGMTGAAVRLMQTFLNELRTKFPQIPQLAADGIFGEQTRAAVIAFQNLKGLTPDGIIGQITWNEIVNERNSL